MGKKHSGPQRSARKAEKSPARLTATQGQYLAYLDRYRKLLRIG